MCSFVRIKKITAHSAKRDTLRNTLAPNQITLVRKSDNGPTSMCLCDSFMAKVMRPLSHGVCIKIQKRFARADSFKTAV